MDGRAADDFSVPLGEQHVRQAGEIVAEAADLRAARPGAAAVLRRVGAHPDRELRVAAVQLRAVRVIREVEC